MDAHWVCFIAESVLRLSIPLLMIKPLLGEQGACREKGYVHQLSVDYLLGRRNLLFRRLSMRVRGFVVSGCQLS